MAPRSPDDRQDDQASRAGQGEAPRTPRPQGPAEPSGGQEPPDFGAFVSRSVRSSADRLKEGAGRRRPAPSEPPSSPEQRTPTPIRREKPSRYWRDSFRERSGEDVSASSGARRFLDGGQAPASGEPPEEGTGGGGGAGAWWQSLTSADGEGPNRRLLGLIALGVILLLIVIFLLTRLGGGGGGEETTPTPTAGTVIEQQPGGARSTPSPQEQQQPTTPQETPEPTSNVRRGGDNQRRPTEEGTPRSEVDREIAYGPVARACPNSCLVRVEGAKDATKLFADTGSRPSFAGDDIYWLVSTPDQIAAYEQDASVSLVRADGDTLRIYVVKIPKDRDDAPIADYGTVIDAAGRFRVIEVEQVPARVRGLADAGYAISKLAPPLPSVRDLHHEQPALSDIEIGALMGEVSYDNIAGTIGTLQGIGAGDGASLGTRYYTLAGNQIAAEYLFQEMESYGLKVWYEDFLTPEGILLVNVVGEVPGKDTSAVYGVMAHFDSISDAPGTAPGADDNSTGIAVSLEIARILAGYTLEHPVRITFVNAEEVGILGSNVWARHAQAQGVPIEGVFNVDSVGSNRQGRLLIFNSDARSSWMQDLMIRINDSYGLGNEIMSRQNPAIVADDNMVREQGIEAVMIARELYGWSPYHHSSGDVIDHVSVDNVMSTTYVVLLSVASLVR